MWRSVFKSQSCLRQTMCKESLLLRRQLHIHEYQSQELMRKNGINVPDAQVTHTPSEAEKAAKQLGGGEVVLKAMVLAGGRGKGHFANGFQGGVHMCKSPGEVRSKAVQMLGQRLITKQTGPQGLPCNVLYITEKCPVDREMYFAILMGRVSGGPVMVSSKYGGMDIEEAAAKDPNGIAREPIDIYSGPSEQQLDRIVGALGLPGQKLHDAAREEIKKLYDFFIQYDCTLVEINPFVATRDGRVLCLDAKCNFDDNASFRQKQVFAYRDYSQEDTREVAAAEKGINYIGLDGNIGCLVNGAGLAMATMDVIKLYGGDPANFLDIGGGATVEQVTEALRILANDPKVTVILVNIFGGIMRCDTVAAGLIKAVETLGLKKPMVVRLQGTNLEQGKHLLQASPIKIIPADDLEEAAMRSCKIAEIVNLAKVQHLDVNFSLPL